MINTLEIHERIVRLGEEWATCNYAADLLEETKRIELSRLMNKITEGSNAAKETEALANPLYREHIAKMCKARELANIAKVRYESAKIWCDLERTQAATERISNKFST